MTGERGKFQHPYLAGGKHLFFGSSLIAAENWAIAPSTSCRPRQAMPSAIRDLAVVDPPAVSDIVIQCSVYLTHRVSLRILCQLQPPPFWLTTLSKRSVALPTPLVGFL
jgi:hypothetical protein